MNEFYEELKKVLDLSEGDVWTETVLCGEDAGKKKIVSEMPVLDEKQNEGSGENIRKEKKKGGRKKRRKEENKEEKKEENESRIFRERIGRIPRLVICGGGHVSAAVTKLGKMLGFEVTVLEDRPKFADHVRKAGADHVICAPFKEGLAKIAGDSDTWFVIVTRGHRYDAECLETIIKKQNAYVGMMGSKRRVAIVKDQLEEKGIGRELLEQVHTPIGLKIKAETPEEIAVSVMAEIIEVKNSREKAGGYSKELLEKIFEKKNDTKESFEESLLKKVLATIVSRKGSAPRSVGTKMLIMEDGSITGTIGGGCVESEVMQKALLMMRKGEPGFQLCKVDMTADDAEEEGMVCGGVVEVMLEMI